MASQEALAAAGTLVEALLPGQRVLWPRWIKEIAPALDAFAQHARDKEAREHRFTEGLLHETQRALENAVQSADAIRAHARDKTLSEAALIAGLAFDEWSTVQAGMACDEIARQLRALKSTASGASK